MRSTKAAQPVVEGVSPGLLALTATLLLALLLFLPSEALERLWPPVTGDRAIRIVKVVVAPALAAMLAVWLMWRAVPQLLAPLSKTDLEAVASGSGAGDHLRWFVGVRWIVILILAILTYVGAAVTDVLDADGSLPLFCTLGAAAGLNSAFAVLARYPACAGRLLLAQIYVDMVFLAALLHYSGGIENPLSLSLLTHVVLAGILLTRRQCYMVATAACLLLVLVAWGEWSGILHRYSVPVLHHGGAGWRHDAASDAFYVASFTGLRAVFFYFIAYCVSTLVERSRSQERRLKTLASEATGERELLEQALETTAAAIRVVDLDLQPRWISPRWKDWFGADRAAEPAPLARVLAMVRQRALEGPRAVARGTASRAAQVTEVTWTSSPDRRGTSGDRIFRVTTAPLLSPDGRIGEVVQLAQEITKQRQAEVQTMRAAKLAALGELTGHVAHEVNNPIAIVSAKGRLLLANHRDAMSPKVAQEIGTIIEATDRVAGIARNLLSYCRRSPAVRAPLDLRGPVARVLSMIEQRARTSGVRVENRLVHPLPAVLANAHEMEEVFLNLFLNALDAMPNGGALAVSLARDITAPGGATPRLAVAVEDTGTGIPEEVRDRIFEPFFTTKDAEHGTGLGLAICLAILREHGGTIDVAHKSDRGACFTVQLPLAGAGEQRGQAA